MIKTSKTKQTLYAREQLPQPRPPSPRPSGFNNEGLVFFHSICLTRIGKEYSFSDVSLMLTTVYPFGDQIYYFSFMHIKYTFPEI